LQKKVNTSTVRGKPHFIVLCFIILRKVFKFKAQQTIPLKHFPSVIRMLSAGTGSGKVHGHSPLNFLAALITKGCLTGPALQVVVVTVFFKTLLMTAGTQLCSQLTLWVGFSVLFH